MPSIKAVSIAPGACDWLANSSQPRILHVFDQVCNLINEHREILSIVSRNIGNGPFNLVVESGSSLFTNHLTVQSPISMQMDRLLIGVITIHLRDSVLWSPRPDWEKLYARREDIFKQIMPFTTRVNGYVNLSDHSLLSNFLGIASPHWGLATTNACQDLCAAILAADKKACRLAALRLAGLGAGLTPAGDDFILGAVLAAWILHPADLARDIAFAIVKSAKSLTTSLSAAWLMSAGRGEAGILWHHFFDALAAKNEVAVHDSLETLLAAGHTSGVDALSGFLSTFAILAHSRMETCHF